MWDTTCLYTDATKNIDQVAKLSCIVPVFTNIINATLMFAGTVAVIMIIYGGLRMVLSGGDAKQAGAARQIITYAIIGLIIVLFSFALLKFIENITGVNCIASFSFAACNPAR